MTPLASLRQSLLWNIMIRRASTSSTSSTASPPAKRVKLNSPLNYKHGVVLAPMVRSSSLPTRLLSLKYGADLVWGPETVDKAILGCNRAVDPDTGVVSYHREGRPIFCCHPVEKPYLIYQIGTANAELAAKAAAMVHQDVAGIDLNCGCPKPFSTSGGMGAALLSTPDLLCDILKAIRAAVPETVSVSCKIRLMPTEEETMELVRKIVGTGAIRCLTVHCRTRAMRKTEKAMPERLKAVVDLCRELDPELAVVQNGDCFSRDDAAPIRQMTGCDSVMIATAAESNPSCFRAGPLADATSEVIPLYSKLAYYIDNPWSNSKHCLAQFKSPAAVAPEGQPKSAQKQWREVLSKAKSYDGIEAYLGGLDGGKDILDDIQRVLAVRELKSVSGTTAELVATPIDTSTIVKVPPEMTAGGEFSSL